MTRCPNCAPGCATAEREAALRYGPDWRDRCSLCGGSGRRLGELGDRLASVLTCLAIGAGLLLVAVALFGGGM